MSGLLSRKAQPSKARQDRIQFPKDSNEASTWKHVVRFLRLGKNTAGDGWDITYKYIRHEFDLIAGQGPYVKSNGEIGERKGKNYAYCMGSPRNPYSQDSEIELNEAGVAECRSIILPNGVPLHDVDQGGVIHEKCLVWSWSNNHVAIIDRKPVFFDGLMKWAGKMGIDPFYYDSKNPGFDVLLTCPPTGIAYKYDFGCMPPGGNMDIESVKALMQQQFKDVQAAMNPIMTKEAIIKQLGIGNTGAASGGDMDDDPEGDPFNSPGGGCVSRADDGMGGGDALDDAGDDL